MRLKTLFETKAHLGQKSFVAYLTAGDPDAASSEAFLTALSQCGVDVIELGVPHTDPIADGLTNAKAADRALRNGGGLKQTLELAQTLRQKGIHTPLVLFTYYNPLLRMGIENFAKQAAVNGIDGVLVVDMPPEEASEYCKILAAHQVDTIFLASPTTSAERLKWVETYSTGFVYYVCRAGVTGTKEDLPPQLEAEIKKLKTVIKKPICVGFGISTPQQVSAIAQWAEGVVVGSALVKCIEENPATDQALLKLENLTRRLLSALCEQRK